MSPPPGNPLRKPRTIGGIAYLVLTAITLAAVGYAVLADWRQGVSVIGGCLLVGALLRALLNDFDAGMLRVRRTWFDVLLMSLVGLLLIALAATIPNQPGA